MGRNTTVDAATTRSSVDTPPANGASRNFTRVGRSGIEGKGVFARRTIPRGTRIFEYVGERRTVTSVLLDADDPTTRTYRFRLNDQIIVDATIDGNDARFVNHGCEPNCAAYIFDDRIYIYADRDIRRGEELTYDYRLGMMFGRVDRRAREAFLCTCGAPTCRGTMLAPRVRSRRKS